MLDRSGIHNLLRYALKPSPDYYSPAYRTVQRPGEMSGDADSKDKVEVKERSHSSPGALLVGIWRSDSADTTNDTTDGVPEREHPQLLRATIRALAARGFWTTVVDESQRRRLRDVPCVAVIIYGEPRDPSKVIADLPSDVPLIGVGVAQAIPELAARLNHDYIAMMDSCVRHLQSQGATYLGALLCADTISHVTEMRNAFKSACINAHVPHQTAIPTSESALQEAIANFQSARIDGLIVAVNDSFASISNVMAIFKSLGMAIPADVLVIAWSNAKSEEAGELQMTCMSVLVEESGRQIAHSIFDGLASGSFRDVDLPFALAVRSSTNR